MSDRLLRLATANSLSLATLSAAFVSRSAATGEDERVEDRREVAGRSDVPLNDPARVGADADFPLALGTTMRPSRRVVVPLALSLGHHHYKPTSSDYYIPDDAMAWRTLFDIEKLEKREKKARFASSASFLFAREIWETWRTPQEVVAVHFVPLVHSADEPKALVAVAVDGRLWRIPLSSTREKRWVHGLIFGTKRRVLSRGKLAGFSLNRRSRRPIRPSKGPGMHTVVPAKKKTKIGSATEDAKCDTTKRWLPNEDLDDAAGWDSFVGLGLPEVRNVEEHSHLVAHFVDAYRILPYRKGFIALYRDGSSLSREWEEGFVGLGPSRALPASRQSPVDTIAGTEQDSVSYESGDAIVETGLYTALFGSERALLFQPLMLLGSENGLVLRRSISPDRDPVSTVHSINEPVFAIGVTKVKQQCPGENITLLRNRNDVGEGRSANAIVIVGRNGSIAVLAHLWGLAGGSLLSPAKRLTCREYHVPEPVTCARIVDGTIVMTVADGRIAVLDLQSTPEGLPPNLLPDYPSLGRGWVALDCIGTRMWALNSDGRCVLFADRGVKGDIRAPAATLRAEIKVGEFGSLGGSRTGAYRSRRDNNNSYPSARITCPNSLTSLQHIRTSSSETRLNAHRPTARNIHPDSQLLTETMRISSAATATLRILRRLTTADTDADPIEAEASPVCVPRSMLASTREQAFVHVVVRAPVRLALGLGWCVMVTVSPARNLSTLLEETYTHGLVGSTSFPVDGIGPGYDWEQDVPIDFRFLELPARVDVALAFATPSLDRDPGKKAGEEEGTSFMVPISATEFDILDFARPESRSAVSASSRQRGGGFVGGDWLGSMEEFGDAVAEACLVDPPMRTSPTMHTSTLKFSIRPRADPAEADTGADTAFRKCLPTLLGGRIPEETLRKLIQSATHALLGLPTCPTPIILTLRKTAASQAQDIDVDLVIRAASMRIVGVVERALVARLERRRIGQ
ncbi:hypothetical protein BDK51DRAFT_50995, partial [Blyttiomyces helicus]